MLEKHKSCCICTDWTHQKDNCLTPLSKARCGEKLTDGSTCLKFHSKLVHGCGVPYCIASKIEVVSLTSHALEEVDELAHTLMLLEDVPAGQSVARLQWDGGANKILVTHDYAKKAKFKSIPAEYYLQVVGRSWELVKDVIYEFNQRRKMVRKSECGDMA